MTRKKFWCSLIWNERDRCFAFLTGPHNLLGDFYGSYACVCCNTQMKKHENKRRYHLMLYSRRVNIKLCARLSNVFVKFEGDQWYFNLRTCLWSIQILILIKDFDIDRNVFEVAF